LFHASVSTISIIGPPLARTIVIYKNINIW